MKLTVLDTLSLPGNAAKPNEDAFAAEDFAALVLDGATPVNEPLMPGPSDAAWIAAFGARRLTAHLRAAKNAKAALRAALADAEKSFAGLRRRAPAANHEIPSAGMMLVVPREDGCDALWFGDCGAIVLEPGGDAAAIGEAFAARKWESGNAAKLAAEWNLAPTGEALRAADRPRAQRARDAMNTKDGYWRFTPDADAAAHVETARLRLPPGTHVLVASDGFLALATDYGGHDAKTLVQAALEKGLAPLGETLRAAERGDPEGRRFPRFKIHDDATAVLARLD
jgi:hypothetical protein